MRIESVKFQLFVVCGMCLFQATIAAPLGSNGASGSIELRFDKESRVVDQPGKQAATLDLRQSLRARSEGASPADAGLAMPRLQYEEGTVAQRVARIVPDPIAPDNWVLEFWVGEPNVHLPKEVKSRVQMNAYGIEPAYEVYQSVRLFVPQSMGLLAKYPEPVKWFTISEWWNNAGWTKESYPFRISVHLRTAGAGSGDRIYFGVAAQARQAGRSDFKGSELWHVDNRDVEVPLGRWLRLQYYYRQGNGTAGRFALAMTPEGGQRVVVFDVKDSTYHPSDPRPDGLRDFNPIKLYTSGELTDFVRRNGSALQLYWDDLLIRTCGRPMGTVPTDCLLDWERQR
jgi:hypothetical protein